MEYRLFTIVRYNFREEALILSELPGESKTARKIFKTLKAGDRREGRKLRKSEVKQEQRQE
jgi:hypothetical protein